MFSTALRRQFAGEEQLPKYNYHIRDSVITLDDGRLCFIMRFGGVPFESTTDAMLENQYNALNDVFLSLAKSTGSRLAIWCFHDHFKTEFKTNYRFSFRWLQDFSDRYMSRFEHADVYENAFYIALLLKPSANDTLDDAIREIEEIQQMAMQMLRSYECDLLQLYEHNGMNFSEVYEFIAYLYNGFWEPVPVTSLPLYMAVETSTHHHGYRIMETRFPDGGNVFTTFYDLKDYPERTSRGKMNPMLELHFPFLMVFSFTFLGTDNTIRLINQSLNKLESAGDEAVEQQAEMVVARGALQGGEIYFGEFHGALLVRGRTAREAEERGATARSTLSSSCGTQFVPAAVSAPETFFSIFPGNTTRRPRPLPKTTRNLFAVFGMNTYSSGKQYGNPIGDGSAVVPVHTSVRGIYHLNFHYSLPELDSLGEKRAGHTFICGATGAGKTTLQTSLLAFLERFDTKLFAVDKDGSMRGFIEALGGTYFTLPNGEPTGLNPFQLPDTPFNRSFLYDLVAACGRFGRPAEEIESAEDIHDIKGAVDNVFSIPWEHRRFAVLLQNIPDRGPDCLKRKIAQWCYTEDGDGRFAYALDNPTNAFDWQTFRRVGFDVTDFLIAGHPATEPILSYLFHLKNLMQREAGGLLATVVEECWLPMMYPTTSAQILDSLKTGRRRDEFILLVTQSPEDILKNPLLPAVMQQTPTKIYLPNPDAEYRTADGGGYARFGLTIKEFRKLKGLGLQSRRFLIKQGSQSSLVQIDLGLQPGQEKGTPVPSEYVPVFAMAAEDFPLLEEAKAQAGNDPDAWIPIYQKLRKLRNEKVAAASAARSTQSSPMEVA
jgi:type IV secretion system protein VirB4